MRGGYPGKGYDEFCKHTGCVKILMIIPELTIGGAQRSFSQLAIDLSQHHDVELVVFNRTTPEIDCQNLLIHSLAVNAGRTLFDKGFYFIKRIYLLKKLKQNRKPDVSLSFLEGADYINILSSIGEKIIISIRGTKEFDREISGVLGWVRKKLLMPVLYSRPNRIVTVAKYLETEMVEFYKITPNRLKTIYNYYDFEKLNRLLSEPLPQKYHAWLSGKIVISVGRLHPQKNHQFLISIFSQIASKHIDAKLVIIGDGRLREGLLRQARATGLKVYSAWQDVFDDDYRIYFMGEQLNPFPFLKRAGLFVLPSLYEGFPNVLIEAMFAGLPVVAADCNYGPREILIDEYGNKYGALLPIDSNATDLASVWITEIEGYLSDSRSTYHPAEKRIYEFARDRILNLWMDVLERDLAN